MRIQTAKREPVAIGRRAVRGVRKGLYAQGVVVLFDRAPSMEAVTRALDGFVVSMQRAQTDADSWAFAGDSVLVDYRPELNGRVQVDVVERPWPDDMGDPKNAVTLFGAWSMGHFGPTTFPRALERSVQQAWGFREGAALVSKHTAFARVRLSYAFGAPDTAPVQPEGTDPIDELRFVSAVQLALSELPGVLALFNPNGEILLAPERLHRALQRDLEGIALPVEAWTNVRKFRPGVLAGAEWFLFDTPGMGQLDVVDHELAIPANHPSVDEVPGLALTMCAYDADLRGVVGPGDTASDFAGARWRVRAEGDAKVAPPRPVLRWSPEGVAVPAAFGT